jgi:predicted transcriptional regulator
MVDTFRTASNLDIQESPERKQGNVNTINFGRVRSKIVENKKSEDETPSTTINQFLGNTEAQTTEFSSSSLGLVGEHIQRKIVVDQQKDEILLLLEQNSFSINQIAALMGISENEVSHTLVELARTGLAASEEDSFLSKAFGLGVKIPKKDDYKSNNFWSITGRGYLKVNRIISK